MFRESPKTSGKLIGAGKCLVNRVTGNQVVSLARTTACFEINKLAQKLVTLSRERNSELAEIWRRTAQAYQAIQLHKFAHDVPIVEPHLPGIGKRIGEIEIPRLELKAVIIQGDSSQILRRGVGHLPSTAMPGELGNIGLAGHRDTFFRPLRHIRAGDVIILYSSAGRFRYQVESIGIVSPQDIQVLRSSNRYELTLVTCFPFEYIGPAPNRFIVHASLLDPS